MSCFLTRILKEACGGNSRTSVVLTVSPSEKDSRATHQAFQFAKSAQAVRNKPKFNPIRAESVVRSQTRSEPTPPPPEDSTVSQTGTSEPLPHREHNEASDSFPVEAPVAPYGANPKASVIPRSQSSIR